MKSNQSQLKVSKWLVVYWLFMLFVTTTSITFSWFVITGPRITGLSGKVKDDIYDPTNVKTEVAYIDLNNDLVFDVSGTLNQMASARIIERDFSDFEDIRMLESDTEIDISHKKFVYVLIPNFNVTVKDTASVIELQRDAFRGDEIASIGDNGNELIKNYDFYFLLQQIYKHYFEGTMVVPPYEQKTGSMSDFLLDGTFVSGETFNWQKYVEYYLKYYNSGSSVTLYREITDKNDGEWKDTMPEAIFQNGTLLNAIIDYNADVIEQMKLQTANIKFAIVMWALYDEDTVPKNPAPDTTIIDFKVEITQ